MRQPRAELDCCIAEKELFLCRKLFKYSQMVNVIILWLKDLQLSLINSCNFYMKHVAKKM